MSSVGITIMMRARFQQKALAVFWHGHFKRNFAADVLPQRIGGRRLSVGHENLTGSDAADFNHATSWSRSAWAERL